MALPLELADAVDRMMRADLQQWAAECFGWLNICTKLVILGLVFEGPEIYHETTEAVRFVLTRNQERKLLRDLSTITAAPEIRFAEPDSPEAPKWMTIVAFVGWVLIVLGILGELHWQAKAEDATDAVQTFDNARLTATQIRAGSAAASAKVAREETDDVIKKTAALRAELSEMEEQLREVGTPRVIKNRNTFGVGLRKFTSEPNGRKRLRVDIEFFSSQGGCIDCESVAQQMYRILNKYVNWPTLEPHANPNNNEFSSGVTINVNTQEESPQTIRWLFDAGDALVTALKENQISAVRCPPDEPTGPQELRKCPKSPSFQHDELILVRIGPKPLPSAMRQH